MPATLHRFGAFELDQNHRALRLEGRELALQPRVFDLLWFLVENRDRVVSKEELLDTLWPGVVVTESSLQRAVSMARSALQEGAMEDAIRNYSKRGYRFLAEASGHGGEQKTAVLDGSEANTNAGGNATTHAGTNAAVAIGTNNPLTSVTDANRCFSGSQWKDAVQRYAEADRTSPLDAETLERWAIAAQCSGDLQGAMLPLERAAVAYSSRSEHEAAARVNIALARIHIESLNSAVAQGCLRRAQRLLAGLTPGVQHGLLAAMTARLHLYTGDLAAATERSLEARELGRTLQNTDIEAMGLLYHGISVQATGDTAQGLGLQDEAAAAVLAGDVSPLLGGIIYCGMISSCCNCGDWQRAEQWTDNFVRWCQRGNIQTFTGACLIHQAEVFAMSGKLTEAREAIDRADPIIRVDAPWALGDAYRLLGDVHLARGETEAAERSYHEAYSQGWDPYPGYAVLLHKSGRSDEAIDGLKRTAAMTNWHTAERKARYLSYAAQIAAQAGRIDEARELLATLDKEPKCWESGAVAGHVWRARAELLWAIAQQEEALSAFQRAIEVLRQYRAVMDAALARLRLAECFDARGENSAAKMERLAAETVFTAAQATGYLDACRAAD